MPLALCPRCATDPSGIDGHPALKLDADPDRKTGFACADCVARWSRLYAGGGAFEWRLENTESPR